MCARPSANSDSRQRLNVPPSSRGPPASGSGTPPPVTMNSAGFVAVDDECAYFSVVDGLDLPWDGGSGLRGTGIYSVEKSYAEPMPFNKVIRFGRDLMNRGSG